MAIYLEWDGGAIEGDVTASGYEGMIRLDSIMFSVMRELTMETGHLANREATRPNLSQIDVSKVMDSASSGLFQEALVGSAGRKVVIYVVKTGADKVEEYVKYELEDALIANYSMSASDSGPPHETLSISYGKLQMIYTAHDKANAAGNQGIVGYDLMQGKKL